MDTLIYLVLGVGVGLALGWLWQKNTAKSALQERVSQIAGLQSETAVLQNEIKSKVEQINSLSKSLDSDKQQIMEMTAKTARLEGEIEGWKTKLQEHQQEFDKNRKQFETQFENLANKILEEKTRKFTEINRTSLDIILNPLKEKISEFEKKVEQTYTTEAKERHSLQNEVKSLVELNTRLNDEAQKLTRALKGDTKKQGNWGEIILAKILESSGLREGREYETQYSTMGEDNNRLYPDVVVKLPEGKHLIIDSKVSLVAYERLVNAETPEDRINAINEHVISVKSHIRMLSEKNYFKAKDIKSPDFVLMFMPVEASFGAAIEADSDLFSFAWDRKIVIVSPSTLLATLKTVASLWRQENQNLNAARIATEAGNLYDKFEGLVSDLQKLGSQLNTVKKTYDDSFNKLKEGRGNLISRVQNLKKLGAKASKNLDSSLLEEALANNDESEELDETEE